jgi:hypothetical protein
MGLANGFLGLHLVISVGAVYGAWRLRGALRDRRVVERRTAAAGVTSAASESAPARAVVAA